MREADAGREGYVEVPGGRVWYQIVGAGPRTPLLTLHGGPGFPHDYLEPLAALADERPVVFYDQLGCGRSDRPDEPALWTVERFVAELARVRAALGLARAHLLGHSWGTMLAVDSWLTQPAGIASLILASPCLSIPRWLADLAAYRARLPAPVREQLARHEADGTTESPEYQAATMVFYQHHVCRLSPWPEPLQRALQGQGAPVYRAMWGVNEFHMTGSLATYDRSDRLGAVDAPTLLTCGAFDEATPAATRWYQSLIPGAEGVVFPASAHMPHLEEPEPYLAMLRAFLARVE